MLLQLPWSQLLAHICTAHAHGMHERCVSQVFTTKQWAAMIVYAYPFFPCLEQWLDTFSSQHSAPSSKDVLMSAREHPLEAEWAALDDYIVHITQTYRPDYVPVQRSFAPPPSHRVPRAALPPVSLHDMLL